MRRSLLVARILLAAVLPLAACSCQRAEPAAAQTAALAPEPGREEPEGAAVRTEPALSRDPAPFALARLGRPVIGHALGCGSELPLACLTADQLAALGAAAEPIARLPLPQVSGMRPVQVEWRSDTAEPTVAWQIGKGEDTLYLTPWGEVLAGGPALVRSTRPVEATKLLERSLGATEATLSFPAPEGQSWGAPDPRTVAALRSCYLIQLGLTAEARAAAEEAGAEGFAALPAALARTGHQAAIEGLVDGWSHHRAWWTLEQVRGVSGNYAGQTDLVRAQDVLERMAAEDLAPLTNPDPPGAAEMTPGGARYLVWCFRDSGGPPELRMAEGVGDPVTRLLAGGTAATEVLAASLDDDRLTRQLAEQGPEPLPRLLTFGDLALELLEARLGTSFREPGEPRLSALSPERRATVIQAARAAIAAP